MKFQQIRDPDNLLDGLDEPFKRKWAQVVEDLQAGRDGVLKGKHAPGHVFAVNLTRGGRLVFVSHTNTENQQELILMGAFPTSHDDYEACLDNVYGKYSQWVESGRINEGSITELTDISDAAACGGEPVIEDIQHYHQRYFDGVISLSDEQKIVITQEPPLVVLGPAGSGKTVSAIMMLENLAEQLPPDVPEITYVGPPNLIHALQQQWMQQSAQKNKDRVRFLTRDEFLYKHLPEEHALIDERDCPDWIKTQLTGLQTINTKLKSQKSLLTSESIYIEFQLIASYGQDHYIKKSPLDHDVKKAISNLHNDYLRKLKKECKIHPLLSADLLDSISGDFCSALFIDEVQQYSVPMLKWLGKTPNLPVCFFGDEHQCTIIDPSLNNLKQLPHYFPHLKNEEKIHRLESTYRNPPQIAMYADRLLKVKKRIVGSVLKSTSDFTSHRKDIPGQCCWLPFVEDSPIEDLKPLAATPDMAFVVFTLADKELINNRYGTELVFFPDEITGLEFPYIVIARPEECLEKVKKKYWNVSKDEKTRSQSKDKSIVIEENVTVLAINKLFIAITRALDSIYFLTDKSKEKFITRFKDDLPNDPIDLTLKEEKLSKEDLKQKWLTLIENLMASGVETNKILALSLWKIHAGTEEEFEKKYYSQEPSSLPHNSPLRSPRKLIASPRRSPTRLSITNSPTPTKIEAGTTVAFQGAKRQRSKETLLKIEEYKIKFTLTEINLTNLLKNKNALEILFETLSNPEDQQPLKNAFINKPVFTTQKLIFLKTLTKIDSKLVLKLAKDHRFWSVIADWADPIVNDEATIINIERSTRDIIALFKPADAASILRSMCHKSATPIWKLLIRFSLGDRGKPRMADILSDILYTCSDLLEDDHVLETLSKEADSNLLSSEINMFTALSIACPQKLMGIIKKNNKKLLTNPIFIEAISTCHGLTNYSALIGLTQNKESLHQLLSLITQDPDGVISEKEKGIEYPNHCLANNSLLAQRLSKVNKKEPRPVWFLLIMESNSADGTVRINTNRFQQVATFFLKNLSIIKSSPCIMKAFCAEFFGVSLMSMIADYLFENGRDEEIKKQAKELYTLLPRLNEKNELESEVHRKLLMTTEAHIPLTFDLPGLFAEAAEKTHLKAEAAKTNDEGVKPRK